MTRRFAIGLLVVTGVCIASGMHIECVDNEEGQGFKDPKADLQLPCFQGGEDVCSKVFPENESQRDFCKNICCATQKVSNSTPPARHLRAKVIPTMPGTFENILPVAHIDPFGPEISIRVNIHSYTQLYG